MCGMRVKDLKSKLLSMDDDSIVLLESQVAPEREGGYMMADRLMVKTVVGNPAAVGGDSEPRFVSQDDQRVQDARKGGKQIYDYEAVIITG